MRIKPIKNRNAKAVPIGDIAKALKVNSPVNALTFARKTGLTEANARARLKLLVADKMLDVNKTVTPFLYTMSEEQRVEMLAKCFRARAKRGKRKAKGAIGGFDMGKIEQEARKEYCEHLLKENGLL